MIAEYFVDNDMNNNYATKIELRTSISQTAESIMLEVDEKIDDTKEELNSTITETAGEINLEVNKKVNNTDFTGANILLKINNDESEAQIKASKIKLEGYTTINGGFAVDSNGNASIANNTVNINQNGISLKTGAKIVGGDGVLTNFQYIFRGTHPYGEIGDFYDLGFYCIMGANNYKSSLIADVYIPNNFTITEAKVILYHTPIYYSDINAYGYSRALKLYKASDMSNYYKWVNSVQGTDVSGVTETVGYSEISNGLGVSSYTPSVPSSSNHKLETRIGNDIKNSLSVGNQRIKIESSNSIPTTTSFETCARQTGFCRAVLNVVGYTKN